MLRYCYTRSLTQPRKNGRRRSSVRSRSTSASQAADSFTDGINHATKAFINRAKIILLAGVQPVFVFDGPARPITKRHTDRHFAINAILELRSRERPSESDIAERFKLSHIIPLVKSFLRLMGVASHNAPGEAEAECVSLEKAGVVDGILTTDGDVFAFGSRHVLRYKGSLSNEHLQRVDHSALAEAGYSSMNWTLLAWLSKGDYSDGLRGCGPRTALRLAKELKVAKPELERTLVSIASSTVTGKPLEGMLQRLRQLLIDCISSLTNPGTKAKWKEPDFPGAEILGRYVRPVVSTSTVLGDLGARLWRTHEPAYVDLRRATANHFAWHCKHRARQFLCGYAPALLAQRLLSAGHKSIDITYLGLTAKRKKQDGGTVPMFAVKYDVLQVVPIDYDQESLGPSARKSWDKDNKKDPHKPYSIDLPEFLLRWGAPACLNDIRSLTTSERRAIETITDKPKQQCKKRKQTPIRKPLLDTVEPRGRALPDASTSRAPVSPHDPRPSFKVLDSSSIVVQQDEDFNDLT